MKFRSIWTIFNPDSLELKTVLFQTTQFSISTLFGSIWSIDRTLSGATNTGQSGLGTDVNKVILLILQCSNITRVSQSDCLVSYQDIRRVGLNPPQRSCRCFLLLQPTGPVSKGVFRIPQSSCIIGALASDFLCQIQDTDWGFYSSPEIRSVYSTAPANWASVWFVRACFNIYALRCLSTVLGTH